MAISEAETGTKSTTGSGTEDRLNTTDGDTTDGIYQFFLDLTDLQATETIIIRVYEKVVSAGTMRVVFRDSIAGALASDDYGWVSPAIVLMHGWKITIATNAAAVSIPWSIRKVA